MASDEPKQFNLLYAELSEIEIQEKISGVSREFYNYNSVNGKWFVFLKDSDTGEQIINSPEEIVEVDLAFFTEELINVGQGIPVKGFAHRSVWAQMIRNVERR